MNPNDPEGYDNDTNDTNELDCGGEAGGASPPTPSSGGDHVADAAASADPGGHQVAGPEAVGNEDSDAPRHAEGRSAERRSDAEVGPSSSQAPATFYNSAAADAGAGGLTTAELSFTGDGEGAQQDEAASEHELLEELRDAPGRRMDT